MKLRLAKASQLSWSLAWLSLAKLKWGVFFGTPCSTMGTHDEKIDIFEAESDTGRDTLAQEKAGVVGIV